MNSPETNRQCTTTGEIRSPQNEDVSALQEMSPGAKLLCIDDSNLHRTYYPGPPIKGQVYCVREIFDEYPDQGVLLVGITGPMFSDGLECGFYLSRFRWVHD